MAAHLEGDGAIAMAAVAADAPDAPPPPVLESSPPAAAAPKPKPKPKRSSGCCSKPVDDFRDVVILDRDANQGSKFGDNSISTSKYNIFNFLPKSVAEQFKRVANFWLLFMSLVMIIGQYFPQLYKSPLNGWSCFGPLCFVIAVTMLKVGLEDIARHVADYRVNNGRVAEVVAATNGGAEVTKWKSITAGDIVVIHGGDQVPADLIIIGTSQDQGEVHIETSNIDGETNLKLRQAVIAVREWCEADGSDAKDAATITKLATLTGTVHCEVPNPRIESFIGSIRDSKQFAQPVSLSNKNVVLRGCTVHQCEWIAGLAVYTGKQTKVMQKSSSTSAVKFSNMEKLVNKCIYVILSTSITLALISASLKQISWAGMLEHWYLQLKEGTMDWNLSDTSPGKFLADFLVFLILYYGFVPLSVYITMEIVNLFHSFSINWDELMYHEETNTPANTRTAALAEDLGQIEYIFSDKTGTLTQNVMVFRVCTTAPTPEEEVGVTYGIPTTSSGEAALLAKAEAEAEAAAKEGGADGVIDVSGSTKEKEAESAEVIAAKEAEAAAVAAIFDDGPSMSPEEARKRKRAAAALQADSAGCCDGGLCRAWARTPFCSCIEDKMEEVGWMMAKKKLGASPFVAKIAEHDRPVVDAGLLAKLEGGAKGSARDIVECLAVCHTVMPKKVNGDVIYEAESPDEGALVNMARYHGWKLTGRTQKEIILDVQGHEERWTVEAINEFSSARKCMSMLCSAPDGRYVLWVKGADSVMLAMNDAGAGPNADKVREWLVPELDRFAAAGLRTLILGKRELSKEDAEAWLVEFHVAEASDDRDNALKAAARSIETGVQLVGATGIEDKLQDGVPGTIADLAVAGIKLWVLTGDKMETAINIGKTCNLLRPGMESVELRGESWDPVTKKGGGRNMEADMLSLYKTHVPLDVRRATNREHATTTWLYQKMQGLVALMCSDERRCLMRLRPHAMRLVRCCGCLCKDDTMEEAPPAGTPRTTPALSSDNIEIDIGAARKPLAVVVDGDALLKILRKPQAKLHFEMFAKQCATVIACRVSPMQKAEMVNLIQDSIFPSPITLAIGDGANDVDMIQAACVGIGISGKEGLQAVNASDFSIAQFRYLGRLLLVHGRWNYRRMSMVLLYSFYKNITIAMGTFVYSIFTGWSGCVLFPFLSFPLLSTLLTSRCSCRCHPACVHHHRRSCSVPTSLTRTLRALPVLSLLLLLLLLLL